MRALNWSIRTKLIVLLLPPLATLLAMWIFATSLTLGDVQTLFAGNTKNVYAGQPAEKMLTELQRERRVALQYLGGGRADPRALYEQRAKTDASFAQFKRISADGRLTSIASDFIKQRIDEVVIAYNGIGTVRAAVDAGSLDRLGALRQYSDIADATQRLVTSLPEPIDATLDRESNALVDMSRGREYLSREDALIHGAAAAGRFGPGEHAELVKLIGVQRFVYATALPDLPAAGRDIYLRTLEGDTFGRIRQMEDQFTREVRANGTLPVDITIWRSTYDLALEQFRGALNESADEIISRAEPVAKTLILRLAVAAIFGFLALGVSLFLAIRVGRSLIRRLSRLRTTAENLAERELPDTVARLRRGEDVELPLGPPSVDLGTDEIGQVANAFGKVQETALDSAVQEARLRKGLNEVFLNLARRSQTLVHRQLSMLDRMERRTTDPEELEDLFRVDHLATRMRRHAEDLVIIAGAAPGRGWRNPVPIVDVIRGAVSEVEDYARCVFSAIPDAALAGRAVADVIHLLAEIIENATSFSPPHTRVLISGQLVPNGLALEIEDRGLGMTSEAIEDANERLVHPPDFDPASSARLGLFVVALLAARHGIRVTLRTSPYGGITAVVLIPKDLVVTDRSMTALPSMAPVFVLESAGADGESRGRHSSNGPRTAINGPQPVSPTVVPVNPPIVPVMLDPVTVEREPEPEVTADDPLDPARLTPPPAPAGVVGPELRGSQAHSSPSAGVVGPELRGSQAHSSPSGEVTIGDDGLPRRRRQANLAPQLRGSSAPAQPVPEKQAQPNADRSPDDVRTMMSSFQAGLTRGRRDAAATLDLGGQHDEERDT
jgi:signal transduction histidine kinase